ncbi:serine--tRNA ligase [Sandaracinobacteroides hominis]|uniref:serine--tRNA ligase n=1 Tax=Sandaracinobacteroides hominis TaxID=2780086 RepID=UPI0018F4F6D7|nr:serine--tRNA ligase [Sandaracinobacteroides hominis]
MHDLKTLRADPAAFDAALARRGVADASAAVLAADARLRAAQTALQAALARRNDASRAIGAAKAAKDNATADALMAEVAELKIVIADGEAEEREAAEVVDALVSALPNQPLPEVPAGSDEHGNVEEKRWGTPRNGGAEHDALAARLGSNPDAAAKVAGARFMVLEGQLARLHRALGQFMLDRQVAAGWRETVVPLLVKSDAMFGTGQLPKFAEDSFNTIDGRWLIPTAEVSLTNLVREQILDGEELPLRLAALTPCFRSEAGAAGKDTRGLIRQHQFEKVELVTICAPEAADPEHEKMLLAAEAILEALELPYRRMLLCTGDMGFTARKTYDLEVWLPGAGAYREISSISQCGDFQARRMDARFRVKGEKGTQFVHTLNGSGLAVGRALVAVLENYQQPDGSVRIPDALKPYMGGIEALIPTS